MLSTPGSVIAKGCRSACQVRLGVRGLVVPGGDNRLCERTTGKLAGAVPGFSPATGFCHSGPSPPSPPASSPPATPGPPPKFSKPAACGRTGPFCQPAAAGRRSRRMVPENDIGRRRRPVEKSHRGVITVLLSTAVCTNFLIFTDALVIETTSTELTTAVALGKRRRGPRLELGPRS